MKAPGFLWWLLSAGKAGFGSSRGANSEYICFIYADPGHSATIFERIM